MRNGSTTNDSDDQRDGQKCVESTVVEEGMMMLISAHLLPYRHLFGCERRSIPRGAHIMNF
jgi:hypothetical protein